MRLGHLMKASFQRWLSAYTIFVLKLTYRDIDTAEMKKEKPIKQELTRAELEIMQILWTRNGAFVHEVLDDMPEPKPAYNTVSTIVRILERKGAVTHEAFGKSHKYIPLFSKEEYTRSFMRNVAGNFFDHSFTQMVSFLTMKEDLSVKEVEEIAAIAKQAIEARKKSD